MAREINYSKIDWDSVEPDELQIEKVAYIPKKKRFDDGTLAKQNVKKKNKKINKDNRPDKFQVE